MAGYTYSRKPETVTAVRHDATTQETFEALRAAGLIGLMGFGFVGLAREQIELNGINGTIAVAKPGDWIVLRGDGQPTVMPDAQFHAEYAEANHA